MEQPVLDNIAAINSVGSFPVTTSVYDMGDRRTEVNHPASGITSFTYDALGNVLTKQTANMAEEGKMITYTYDYHRLTGINYPDHPENNVKYYYGGRNASHNRIGRLMLREDGTGAIEYFYGKMGEVTKTRRTLIVPNQAIATYVTQWTYDSHNRLVEMIYPDEEKITYSYNLGGLLEKVRGEKSYGYDYITKLGYDKFEQRSYLKYCNGAETFYTYDNRRRLSNLAVNSGGASIMDNAYTFDAVSNVLSVANNASLPQSGNAGGQMSHSYTYDGLYRLASATGTYTGADSKSASYTLDMGYDNMHRITSKRQHLTQDNVQFNGTLNVGYDLSYTYSSEEGKKFQLESVKDVNYRTEETSEGNNVENGHVYTYDKNGNLVYVNTSRMMTDGHRDNSVGERKLIWDEENRLLSVDDNGFVSNYWYDADGERTVKTSGESDQVYVNGVFSGGSTNTAKFSLYVSPYLVANQGGRYTKHIYAGSQRIVSKVGDFASYGSDPRRIEYAGSETDGLTVDYKSKYTAQQQVIKDHYQFFDVPYNGTDNNNYADGEGFCCNDGTLEAAQAKAMRKAQSRAVAKSFKDPDNYENLQFFYHPDHLGSSSFITNLEGDVVQHIEYVPFGEVFIEERNSVWNTPYLFNAKEFDEETGMYYYGARYYEPRLSLWMSTDPMSEKYFSLSAYSYCFNNPISVIDPDGLQGTKSPYIYNMDDPYSNPYWYRDYGLGIDQIWNSAVNGLDNIELSLIRCIVSDKTNANLIRKAAPSEFANEFRTMDDALLVELFQVKFINRNPTVIPKNSLGEELADLGLSVLDLIAVAAPSKVTGVLSSAKPVALSSISNALRGAKTLIKQAQLPSSGKIRFVPKASDIKNGRLTKLDNGYVDKFGNIWTKGPSRTKGELFEWDVQLSKQGRSQLGHLSPDGNHLNVSLKGKITH